MFQKMNISVLAMGLGLLGLGCGEDEAPGSAAPSSSSSASSSPSTSASSTVPSFSISSPAVQNGQTLPDEYTCAGRNFPFSGSPPVDHVLPQLNWTAGPANTQSYAIVFKDVTLTTGTPMNELGYHWAIYNIPASVFSLPKGLPSGNPIAAVPGAKQYSGPLFNDGYVGPCPSWSVAPGSPLLGTDPPPTVSTDSYTFTVFALPFATVTEPTQRPAPAEGEPPISYVRDLDDYFIAQAIGTAQLATTSSAQPAMFATPP